MLRVGRDLWRYHCWIWVFSALSWLHPGLFSQSRECQWSTSMKCFYSFAIVQRWLWDILNDSSASPLFCTATPCNGKGSQALAKNLWSLSEKCVGSVRMKQLVSGDRGSEGMLGSTGGWRKTFYPLAATCDCCSESHNVVLRLYHHFRKLSLEM